MIEEEKSENSEVYDRVKIYDIYYRTRDPWSLDEVLYVIHHLGEGAPIQMIADLIKRLPFQIEREFLKFRPKRKDGTYDSSKSVSTRDEAENFDFKKQTIINKWSLVFEGEEDDEKIEAEAQRFKEGLDQRGWPKL